MTAAVTGSPQTQSQQEGQSPKVKVSKLKKTHAPASHPPYIQMIKKALGELKEKKGASKGAILKFIVSNFDVGGNQMRANAQLKQALKRGVSSGDLKQVKGVGASGSFKLGDETVPKPTATIAKKIIPKKTKSSPVKAKAVVKKAAKKPTPKKSPKKAAVKKSPAKTKPPVKKTAPKPVVAPAPVAAVAKSASPAAKTPTKKGVKPPAKKVAAKKSAKKLGGGKKKAKK
uniref:H15 domain-containing protein n=1 Tax=Globodera rostochiensis TaxID=31243 RepID=A0A914HE96_GLORO